MRGVTDPEARVSRGLPGSGAPSRHPGGVRPEVRRRRRLAEDEGLDQRARRGGAAGAGPRWVRRTPGSGRRGACRRRGLHADSGVRPARRGGHRGRAAPPGARPALGKEARGAASGRAAADAHGHCGRSPSSSVSKFAPAASGRAADAHGEWVARAACAGGDSLAGRGGRMARGPQRSSRAGRKGGDGMRRQLELESRPRGGAPRPATASASSGHPDGRGVESAVEPETGGRRPGGRRRSRFRGPSEPAGPLTEYALAFRRPRTKTRPGLSVGDAGPPPTGEGGAPPAWAHRCRRARTVSSRRSAWGLLCRPPADRERRCRPAGDEDTPRIVLEDAEAPTEEGGAPPALGIAMPRSSRAVPSRRRPAGRRRTERRSPAGGRA